ncbi:MAG: hypothetical protein ACLQVD_03460 [Capsulimonadaceae bacterium]
MDSDNNAVNETLAPATRFFSVGAELLTEVQRVIGASRVRSLRIKLGSRVVKEIPIAPLTAAATVILVLLAVVVSKVSIEVEHEPATKPA